MNEKSNTGLIIVVIVIVVILVGSCGCAFLSMGGCCVSGPAISDVFSGVNSALQTTPIP